MARTLTRLFTRFAGNARGNAVTLFALSVIPILGAVGAGVDYSNAASMRTNLQAAADMAAIAGVRHGADRNRDALAMALFDANIEPGVSVTSKSGTGEGEDRYTVSATGSVATSMMRLLGIPALDVRVVATAVRDQSDDTSGGACFTLLDPAADGGLRVNGTGRVRAPDCETHVASRHSASTIINSGSVYEQARICTAGGAINRGSTGGPLEEQCDADGDPFAGTLMLPTAGACDFNNHVVNAGPATVSLSPGTYCGNTIVNGSPTVTLDPGVYVLTGPMIFNSGTRIVGDRVSFHFTSASAVIMMNGQMEMSLKAPSTGPRRSILMTTAQGLGAQNFIFNTALGQHLEGIIWMPSFDIQFNSRSLAGTTDRLSVVANTMIVNAQADWRVMPLGTTVTRLANPDAPIRLIR